RRGDALAFMNRGAGYEDAPRPDVIILDLNLPRTDGRQVLATVKADPELASIPVVVFSSSRAAQDVVMAYEHPATCYVAKPDDYHAFEHAVQTMGEFWFSLAELPSRILGAPGNPSGSPR
ncbi:MAG: response regulator, partial [Candidatus Thermoplasmatota archaeon]|nr:response regulator [Candidatus Thermoplasmatota archaeon]